MEINGRIPSKTHPPNSSEDTITKQKIKNIFYLYFPESLHGLRESKPSYLERTRNNFEPLLEIIPGAFHTTLKSKI